MSKSVLSLQLHGDEFLNRVVHDLWLQRSTNANGASPYFQRFHGTISVEHPNLAIVNPDQALWSLPGEFGNDESVFDAWHGETSRVTVASSSLSVPMERRVSLSRRGIVSLPVKDRGMTSSFSSSDIDSIVDSLRSLAEACDFIDSIDLFTSVSAESFAPPQELLQSIRDDFGTSVLLPLYVSRSASSASLSPAQRLSSTLGLPFIYSECQEAASMIIPLQEHREIPVETVSSSLYSLSHFRSSLPSSSSASSSSTASKVMSSREWWHQTTVQGRFPVLSLEGSLSSLSLSSVSHSLQTLQREARRERQESHSLSAGAEIASNNYFLRNPFLVSLSPIERDRDREKPTKREEYHRPWSNFLSLHYAAPLAPVLVTEVTESLYLHCLNSSFSLSGCVVTQTERDRGREDETDRDREGDDEDDEEAEVGWERRDRGTDRERDREKKREEHTEREETERLHFSIASLGCSPRTGTYLLQERDTWRESFASVAGGQRLREAFHLEEDEVEEVAERLETLAERYMPST